MWFTLKLVFFLGRWKERHDENPSGEIIEEYYLIEAINIQSAIEKARIILKVSDGGDSPYGYPDPEFFYRAVGISDLTHIDDQLVSGAAIYSESIKSSKLGQAKHKVLTPEAIEKMKLIKPDFDPPLEVWFGPDFDT